MSQGTVVYEQGGKLCVTRLITFKCNNNCLCCISPYESRHKKEYSWKELLGILKHFPTDSATIDINGGEPTCTPLLKRTIAFLKKNHPKAQISILTNGRAFSYKSYFTSLDIPSNVRFLIGLYGHNARLHDTMTRACGSFRQTLQGIANLLEEKQSVEIRVIVTKRNFRYIPAIAQFMRKRFPDARHVIISAKYTGEAFRNRRFLFVKISDVVPYLVKAFDSQKSLMLYHFPLCVLPKRLWKGVPGMTVPSRDVSFAPQCSGCRVRDRCPGLWKSYAKIAGFGELKPITGKKP